MTPTAKTALAMLRDLVTIAVFAVLIWCVFAVLQGCDLRDLHRDAPDVRRGGYEEVKG